MDRWSNFDPQKTQHKLDRLKVQELHRDHNETALASQRRHNMTQHTHTQIVTVRFGGTNAEMEAASCPKELPPKCHARIAAKGT